MARYRGPQSKIARRFNEPIFGPDKALERKSYGPGQHGNNRRAKKSEYATQLAEKQKAKYTYGILEKQFSNLFKEASRRKGITGETLLQLCETRLDNIVYRLGIAPSRRAARQLVTHRHITVNGTIVNIPSYSLNVGDTIAVREKSKSLEVISTSLSNSTDRCEYVEWNPDLMNGKLTAIPLREQISENIKEQLIVELYSK
ncbi:MAG: 30S ribosomal protein S4 [Bacteroidota bacterium]|nr:30S ribosomal protein S4 [Bacteroidota bacterium]